MNQKCLILSNFLLLRASKRSPRTTRERSDRCNKIPSSKQKQRYSYLINSIAERRRLRGITRSASPRLGHASGGCGPDSKRKVISAQAGAKSDSCCCCCCRFAMCAIFSFTSSSRSSSSSSLLHLCITMRLLVCTAAAAASLSTVTIGDENQQEVVSIYFFFKGG